jgi:hypothetical protein
MLDFVGTMVMAALMMLVVNALLTFMEISRAAKLLLAAVIGLWIGLAAAVASTGALAIAQPFPVIGIFVAAPLIFAAVAAIRPDARRAMLGLPLRLMIGLNICRVFAVLFLLLALEGRLAGPFPYFAGAGDIITGVCAIPLMMRVIDDKTPHRAATAAWNVFGMADLVLAITLGVISTEGSPLQLVPAPGSAAMQTLPWSFVPTVLVPIWMILHAIIWARLRRPAGAPA